MIKPLKKERFVTHFKTLLKIEEKAITLYTELAQSQNEDKIKVNLEEIAGDERKHKALIEEALEILTSKH